MERDKLGRFLKGKSASPETQFKKGVVPWNKGKKGVQEGWSKGLKKEDNIIMKNMGFKKGHPGYNKGGNTWSMESRMNKSLAQTGEKEFKGFKRCLRDRIMMMREYLQWRADVFKRDNYHCQNCSEKGYIEAHHIIPFSKLLKIYNITTSEQARKCKELWDIGNGITYCRECHILLDNQIGKRGKSKQEQLNATGGL